MEGVHEVDHNSRPVLSSQAETLYLP